MGEAGLKYPRSRGQPAQPAREVGFPLQRPSGSFWDAEPCISVGFNAYFRLSVKANLLKPETKSSSGKLRWKKTPEL